MTRPGWRLTTAAAFAGALTGLLYVWLTRNQTPEVKTLANGMRVIQPMYVMPTPWWVYSAFAVVGAVVALLAAWTVARFRRT